jgi:3-deoxy-D-manno-octulosonic-acid transferase
MADNYVQFSEMITGLNKKEKDWLEKEYKDRRDQSFENDFAYPEEGADFELIVEKETNRKYSAWLHADEFGDVVHVAELVHEFLKKFRPKDVFSLTYSETCSKPRLGEFSGGAIVVTAYDIKYMNASTWAEQESANAKRS